MTSELKLEIENELLRLKVEYLKILRFLMDSEGYLKRQNSGINQA